MLLNLLIVVCLVILEWCAISQIAALQNWISFSPVFVWGMAGIIVLGSSILIASLLEALHTSVVRRAAMKAGLVAGKKNPRGGKFVLWGTNPEWLRSRRSDDFEMTSDGVTELYSVVTRGYVFGILASEVTFERYSDGGWEFFNADGKPIPPPT